MTFQAKAGEPPSMIDRMRARLLQDRIGILSDLTSEQWLELATEADSTYRDIGPFDGAAPHFAQQREDYLAAAAFVERFPGVTPR